MSISNIYIVDSSKGSINHTTSVFDQVHLFSFPCSNVSECSPYSVTFSPGVYRIECWGASGGDSTKWPGGRGSFTSGNIAFSSSINLYLFLGGSGNGNINGSFNGGGTWIHSLSRSGGGSTDIRLSDNSKFEGLRSRIMVAAGGGGSVNHGAIGESAGYGGDLVGSIGGITNNTACSPWGSFSNNQIPANQTHGGISHRGYGFVTNGQFGIGGSIVGGYYAGTGGGGYYGGSTGDAEDCLVSMGGGGSSFVSGHPGCDAISIDSTKENIVHTGRNIHYSGHTFTSSVILNGSRSIPCPTFTNENEIGHAGNGFVRITILHTYEPVISYEIRFRFTSLLLFHFLLQSEQ